MGNEWVNFFENNNNIINGYSQDFKNFFFKSAFINEPANSFAIVFRRPLFSQATIELFSVSDELISPMLNELFRILHSRGITYTQLTMFNIKQRAIEQKGSFCLLKKLDYAIQLMFLGKPL